MTPLAELLISRIAASGPISLADYMAECLLHPKHGYYSTRDPFGTKGDFITAPEISQMYGEMIGLCLAQCWLDQGAPAAFALAELGPGRGTLMTDILRATEKVPSFHAAAQVHLIEASPTLRHIQSTAVPSALHIDSLADLPDLPLFLVANEFFDALPIRQFTRQGDGWAELQIGLRDGTLAPGLSPPAPISALRHRLQDTRESDIVELSPALPGFASCVSDQIARNGGAALIIDYGDWRSQGDTLQALSAHEPVDPFAAPGTADLTAHVDFEAIALAATSCRHTKLTPQGVFLERLGITARAQSLAQNLSGLALDEHVSAHRRLTHPDEMGHLFKVIGIHPSGTPTPPGLTA